jgi:D-proline reductase (dithiol) PrdB
LLGHISPNYDRSGFITDPNVVFPIDPLHEMAAEGAIGSVASTHVAFLGAQDETMTSIRLDSGPAAGKLLLNDAVDVILLTPV